MVHPFAGARRKYAAALLSPSSLHHLRVPDEFAARLGGGEEGAAERDGRPAVVLLVSPLGKVWRAELRRAGVGAGGGAWQLGGGWAEFVAAHGVAAGWSVVFRLERRGVATVRAFDAAGCLARFCRPHAGVAAGKSRPRFVRLLHPEDKEKMRIPDKFVQEHLMTGACPSIQKATIFSPLGKFWRVEIDRDQSCVLLGESWAQFLTAHDLSEGCILLFRYEGNMVFTVEAFLQNGCLKEYRAAAADDEIGPSTVPQQGEKGSAKKRGVSRVKKRRKTMDEDTCVDVHHKKPQVFLMPAKKFVSQKNLVSTVPRCSYTKQITGYDLKSFLTHLSETFATYGATQALKMTFCSSVGLSGACEIILKTLMDNTGSWPVSFSTANTYGYITGPGWRRFCLDNKVKEGDRCTFSVVKTRLWHLCPDDNQNETEDN
ncbi:hypothetical protein U9M48_026916 [Paspalum notatum var. saurae]|uniref:TF-B3 domain-containing protein n=1 Tax=Paspalum notatum var. saurae TaxID=547442 RepID=A0AAQ3TTQ0_PASNO